MTYFCVTSCSFDGKSWDIRPEGDLSGETMFAMDGGFSFLGISGAIIRVSLTTTMSVHALHVRESSYGADKVYSYPLSPRW